MDVSSVKCREDCSWINDDDNNLIISMSRSNYIRNYQYEGNNTATSICVVQTYIEQQQQQRRWRQRHRTCLHALNILCNRMFRKKTEFFCVWQILIKNYFDSMVHYFIRQKDFRIFLLIMLLMALNWSIDVLRIQQNTQKYRIFYFSQWLGNKINCIEICSKSIGEYTRAQKKKLETK